MELSPERFNLVIEILFVSRTDVFTIDEVPRALFQSRNRDTFRFKLGWIIEKFTDLIVSIS